MTNSSIVKKDGNGSYRDVNLPFRWFNDVELLSDSTLSPVITEAEKNAEMQLDRIIEESREISIGQEQSVMAAAEKAGYIVRKALHIQRQLLSDLDRIMIELQAIEGAVSALGYTNSKSTCIAGDQVLAGQMPGNNIVNVSKYSDMSFDLVEEFTPGEGSLQDIVAESITNREIEVLHYVARGYGNKQIANTLSISEQTIKNHMTSILHKLDANDRTHAVVMALRKGWISL